MSDGSHDLRERAHELARAFDLAFAEPADYERPDTCDVLAVRIGGRPYALLLAQVAGLFSDRRVTKLPGPLAQLLGVVGFRGNVLPAYDLGALIGSSSADVQRWLVLAAERPIALAFDALDAHWRLPRAAIRLDDGADAGLGVRGTVRHEREGTRPLVHLPAVLEIIDSLLERQPKEL